MLIAFLEGGVMNGSARPVSSKKIRSIKNTVLPNGRKIEEGLTEWYRKTGKTVYLRAGKETFPARVFRWSNVTRHDKDGKLIREKSKKKCA